jgi:hypothetical protein
MTSYQVKRFLWIILCAKADCFLRAESRLNPICTKVNAFFVDHASGHVHVEFLTHLNTHESLKAKIKYEEL